jgi:hypothetical protein
VAQIQETLIKDDSFINPDSSLTGYSIQITDEIFHEAFRRMNRQHDGRIYDEVNRVILKTEVKNNDN